MSDPGSIIMGIYDALLNHFGPRGWWPGETRIEIIIGAILTQAVAWRNVEKSILSLKEAHLLDIKSLNTIPEAQLAAIIKTTLYHRQKAKKIKAMVNFINSRYQGNLDNMFRESLDDLRSDLLSVWGIGEETADSILLYAGNYQIFVVDAYTRRIFARIGQVNENVTYTQMQNFMHQFVQPDIYIYNEYHALLVALGAAYCKKNRPVCSNCPVNDFCKFAQTGRLENEGGRSHVVLG